MADLQPPSEAPINGPPSDNLGPSLVGSKRQRRPSVRLGDIGEQSAAAITYEAYVRRSKQWKVPPGGPLKESAAGKGLSKTRPLVNIGNGDSHEIQESEDKNPSGDLDSVVIGSWKKDLKAKRGPAAATGGPTMTKRVRSNWVSRVEEGAENDEKSSGFNGDEEEEEEEEDGGFRDFIPEGSESPSKERSPIQSMENTDGRDWKCGTTSVERNGISDRRCRSLDDDVHMWLNGLGLGRYAPVFELHEVDYEVLPLLTLEDLKDMGINAVGSRRKMYCAIQRLGKSFT
ncbi:uncharacterized protein LOC131239355 [Magnolia sinica]|uniref:uncharacterized protein LOC131239355 n=1 Tax=Magnolia sinica TaxID=86752 RepID=UPI00265A3F9F|nr:uncharacterized protein LOC131239355 [Magnolia sinica]